MFCGEESWVLGQTSTSCPQPGDGETESHRHRSFCRTLDRLSGLEHTEHCAMFGPSPRSMSHTREMDTARASATVEAAFFDALRTLSLPFREYSLAVLADAAPSTPFLGPHLTAVQRSVSSGVPRCIPFLE